jgi:FkbM family methyltransferase
MDQKLDAKGIVEDIFHLLPTVSQFHNPDSELYSVLNKIIKAYFSNYKKDILEVAPFKGMVWPHTNLGSGTFTSYGFFELHEMPLYSFYWINRDKYKVAVEIGANIGIDSIILNHFGYKVHAFEPDPLLHEIILRNIQLNKCKNIQANQRAISNAAGVLDFIRVKGNSAHNHILGAKDFYGESECIKVEAITFEEIGVQPDLMKINVEGYEKYIIPSIQYPVWEKMDVFIEIHSPENSKVIFDYFIGSNINIFSQKQGWRKVKKFEEMPLSSSEGYIFVSKRQHMPW